MTSVLLEWRTTSLFCLFAKFNYCWERVIVPWCEPCEKYLSPNAVSVVGTCPKCGERVEDKDGQPADSQKIPWHFWVFVGAALIYLFWRLIQGLGFLFT